MFCSTDQYGRLPGHYIGKVHYANRRGACRIRDLEGIKLGIGFGRTTKVRVKNEFQLGDLEFLFGKLFV